MRQRVRILNIRQLARSMTKFTEKKRNDIMSIKERLRQKQHEVKERESRREHQARQKDKGGEVAKEKTLFFSQGKRP